MPATTSIQRASTAVRAATAERVIDGPRPVASNHRPCPHPYHTFSELPSASNSSACRQSSHARVSFHPLQTPLHRGCAGWASPSEAVV